jgi:hypothetical protein
MKTTAEILNNEQNQAIILEKIIDVLRKQGEWGRHGLFTKIGKATGFTSSYVGKVLKGGQPLRENFVQKMAEYLCVSVDWLCSQGGDRKIVHDMWYRDVMGKIAREYTPIHAQNIYSVLQLSEDENYKLADFIHDTFDFTPPTEEGEKE